MGGVVSDNLTRSLVPRYLDNSWDKVLIFLYSSLCLSVGKSCAKRETILTPTC